MSKDKRGVVIALSLPEEDEHKIQEVFNQIGLDQFKTDDGLDFLIKFLDGILLKDELSDSFEKFREFEAFQKATGSQNIFPHLTLCTVKWRNWI